MSSTALVTWILASLSFARKNLEIRTQMYIGHE